MKTCQPFSRGPVYTDIDIGESVTVRTKSGAWHPVKLLDIGYHGPTGRPARAELGWITVQVNETRADVPLGWWRMVDGVRIIADLNSRYNADPVRKENALRRFRLEHDARIFLSDGLHPVLARERYLFPMVSDAWSWDSVNNWLTKYSGLNSGSMTHEGIDLYCPPGVATVRAVVGGEIVYIGGYKEADELGGPGNVVSVLGDDNIGYMYVHMRGLEKSLAEGARIEIGQAIGRSGKTGFERMNTMPHLHFEMVIGESADGVRAALRPPFYDFTPGLKAFRINPYAYLCQWFEEYLAGEDA